MQIYREHVWPYRSLETLQIYDSREIMLDQLEKFAKITGSSVGEMLNAFRIIRNAYELGLIDVDNTSNDSPETAFMKSFLLCEKKGVRKFVRDNGGIEALTIKAIELLRE